MADSRSKRYDSPLDDFIINALSNKNMGYRHLHRVIGEEYRHISFETLGRHIKRLLKSELIAKDTKYAQYYLTEKCKQAIKLGILSLTPPKTSEQKAFETSPYAQLASKQINIHILLLLFKPDTTYEFATMDELENFLSLFGLSMDSFSYKSARFSDAAFKSTNEVYRLEVGGLESDDGRFSVDKIRYQSSPQRQRNTVSFICHIKGIKYPLPKYQSDPFSSTQITQDGIKNVLSALANGSIVQKPIVYSNDSIYLVTDIHLYDLLSVYSYLYGVCRSTLNELWNLRKPTPEEIQWLRSIEGDSGVAKSISEAKEGRNKISYYKRQKLITDLIKRINKTESALILEEKEQKKKFSEWVKKEYKKIPKVDMKEPTIKESIETEFKEKLSNPKYQFIISEIEKFAFPDWFQNIRKKLR